MPAALVNHLKAIDNQRITGAWAYGIHAFSGTLGWSIPGTPVKIRQILAEGHWAEILGVWYKGLNIPPADFIFHSGYGNVTGSMFPMDKAHEGFVMVDASLPSAADADTETNPPTEFKAIGKGEMCPNFDDLGRQVDDEGKSVGGPDDPLQRDYFIYSVNPAIVELSVRLRSGQISRSSINWPKWTACRDFYYLTETQDYRTIPDFEGFGLSVDYFDGTNFDTLKWQRVDPVIEFPTSSGAPALGLPAGSFSAQYRGFIKPEFTETYTFTVDHDNGAVLKVNGTTLVNEWDSTGTATPGTHTGTIALTAGQFYAIELDWNNGSTTAQIRLKWQSASQPVEVIPSKRLYPAVAEKPPYEAHVSFSAGTKLEDALSWIHKGTKMVVQKVDGLYEHYCWDQIEPTFHFDFDLTKENEVVFKDSVVFNRSDRYIAELQTLLEIRFKDLDAQYLEEPETPVSIKFDDLLNISNGREITGALLDFFQGDRSFNMNHWQAIKIGQHTAERTLLKDFVIKIGANAKSFPVIRGDHVTVSSTEYEWEEKLFEVNEAVDASPEETPGDRRFILQEI